LHPHTEFDRRSSSNRAGSAQAHRQGK
jgi:hypothetical protein